MRGFIVGIFVVFMTLFLSGARGDAAAQSSMEPPDPAWRKHGVYVPPNPTPGPYRYQDYRPIYPQYTPYYQPYYVPQTYYAPNWNYQYGGQYNWVPQYVAPPVYHSPIYQPPIYQPPVSRPPIARPPIEWPPFPRDPQPPQSPQGEMCGGMMGATCSNPTEYCHMDISAQCGAADQSGVCRPKPQICTREYAPVCGCDGRTYATQCTANSSGVSAAYQGQCRG